MKRYLAAHLLVMLALTAVAARLRTDGGVDGRATIVWSTGQSPARTAEVAAFDRLHPDSRVVLDHAAYDLRRVVLQCSSGIGPDVFEVWTGQYLQQAVETGVALALDDHVEAFDLGATEELPAFLREEVTYRGRRYASPLSIQTDVLFYNQAVFDRFGVPYPEGPLTWEEFIELSKRVTHISDDPAETVYAVVYMRWEYLFYGLRGEFFSPDGTRPLVDSEPMRRAVQTYRDMILEHRITLPMEAVSTFAAHGGSGGGEFGGAYRQLFADGRFAMVFRPRSILSYLAYAVENQKRAAEEWGRDRSGRPPPERLRIGATLPPHFAGRPPAYWARARSAVINRFSPNRETALRFLAFLRTPEYSRAVNESYDYTPPEPRYRDLGVGDDPDIAERRAHEIGKQALAHGHITRKSPFLQDLEVKRVVDEQIDRLIANPALTVERVLAEAQDELESLVRRNLERDPELRRLWAERRGPAGPAP